MGTKACLATVSRKPVAATLRAVLESALVWADDGPYRREEAMAIAEADAAGSSQIDT
ncbi:MAG: hypothetical protein AMXMBFR80_17950 [Dehalococcoidia bacterium]